MLLTLNGVNATLYTTAFATRWKKVDSYKDLGVTFDKNITFSEHIQEKINKAYSMLGIKRNFIHTDKHIFYLSL